MAESRRIDRNLFRLTYKGKFMSESFDIVVIGAGPAGLSVVAESAFHELGTTLLLEKGKNHNETVTKYYPDNKRVDAKYKGQEAICAGILCFQDTTKTNFLATVDEMIRIHNIQIQFDHNVDSIKKRSDGLFDVSAGGVVEYLAKHVVIAIGRMGKPNRPEFFNQIPATVRKKVQFDVRNIEPEGKDILVVGGGNSAIEFALSLSNRGRVTVSYRKAEFNRLNPMNLNLLLEEEKAGHIRILRESNVSSIGEQDDKPLVHFEDGESTAYDHVIFGIGGSSPAAFLQNAGIKLDDRGNPILGPFNETNVENLYVAGELSVPQGKGSIIVSFNSGKKVIEGIMIKMGKPLKPAIVSLIDQSKLGK